MTGFTIGHSITLSAGFFGFVPKGAWFIPAVEAAIAFSIVYAAVIAIWPGKREQTSEKSMVLVTGAIGLLHGLGFSFVLKNILQVTSPDIWQSLLAFNVGVEIGQLAIVLVVWPALWLLARTNVRSASLGAHGNSRWLCRNRRLLDYRTFVGPGNARLNSRPVCRMNSSLRPRRC